MTHLSWHAALRDLKADRQNREPIRQERLRVRSACTYIGTNLLSAWRGRTGRRYVVVVYTRTQIEADLQRVPCVLAHAVILAVRNDVTTGSGSIIAANEGLDRQAGTNWIASLARAGADEFHVHRLATSLADRQAILLDLTTPDLEAML